MIKRTETEIAELLNIQEKALSNLADTVEGRMFQIHDKINDIELELKALKLFLTRNVPDFKSQFPEIQKKVK